MAADKTIALTESVLYFYIKIILQEHFCVHFLLFYSFFPKTLPTLLLKVIGTSIVLSMV